MITTVFTNAIVSVGTFGPVLLTGSRAREAGAVRVTWTYPLSDGAECDWVLEVREKASDPFRACFGPLTLRSATVGGVLPTPVNGTTPTPTWGFQIPVPDVAAGQVQLRVTRVTGGTWRISAEVEH